MTKTQNHQDPQARSEVVVLDVRRIPATTATHCGKGHEFDDLNTYKAPDGHRECRICKAARAKASYERNKQSPLPRAINGQQQQRQQQTRGASLSLK